MLFRHQNDAKTATKLSKQCLVASYSKCRLSAVRNNKNKLSNEFSVMLKLLLKVIDGFLPSFNIGDSCWHRTNKLFLLLLLLVILFCIVEALAASNNKFRYGVIT